MRCTAKWPAICAPLRRGGEFYPVYLTGVISAEGDAGGPCPLIDLLRLKRTVEERLVAAMQTSG